MKKSVTALDHRIELAVGCSVDNLWGQRDRGLLDEPLTALVDAHRALARAETGVTFHHVLLHRLASGEYPVDAALLARIDRTVDAPSVTAAELSPQDQAALLAIAQGARLREHLLTQRVSVVTASGTWTGSETFRRLESDGLVERDTTRPLHAGQPVTLTGAGRAALSAPPPSTAPAQRADTWPAPAARSRH
ncbi:hypothetical protein [Streptomyces sp. NPDC004726]